MFDEPCPTGYQAHPRQRSGQSCQLPNKRWSPRAFRKTAIPEDVWSGYSRFSLLKNRFSRTVQLQFGRFPFLLFHGILLLSC